MPDPPLTPEELQRAVDARALLPGEDPGSMEIADAVHWIRVYGELVTFKASVLDHADRAVASLSEDALRDVQVDRRLLCAQAARYRARYEYWLERVLELGRSLPQEQLPPWPPDLHIEGRPPLDDHEAGG